MKGMRLFLVVMLFALYGCAAAQTALEHKNLEVQTKMSDTIFLDPVSPAKRTVFLEIKNTSDKDLNLSEVAKHIQANGYKVVNDPASAHYLLQANVLYVGAAKKSAIEETLQGGYGGYGGLLAGAAVGGALTRPGSRGEGMVAAGLVGAAAEMIAGSLVKDVTYAVITDVQISERSAKLVRQKTTSKLKQGGGTGTTRVTQQSEELSHWKRYRTRIASTADKVNLKFDEAKPVIVNGLVRSLSGLF